jgi:hypothetical protein
LSVPEPEPSSAVIAGDQRHTLHEEDGAFVHVWTDRLRRNVISIPSSEIGEAGFGLLKSLLAGEPLAGRGRYQLKFNVSDRFLGGDPILLGFKSLSSYSAERTGDDLAIRVETSDSRYRIECSFRPEAGRMGDYVLSRLNSRGSHSVPDLVGFSYWDMDGQPLIWARVLRKDRGTVPALRPMLTDLDRLIRTISAMQGEEFMGSMVGLSTGEGNESLLLAYRLGAQVAALHADMIIDPPVRTSRSGRIGDRIMSELSVSRMTMGDAGSLLGKLGLYMGGLKREMVRLVGDTPAGSRKQKVVRTSPRHEVFKSRGLEAMPLLSRRLQAKESEIRHRSSILKEMPGSPMIASLLDTSLERAELDAGGNFVFNSFGWRFSGSDGERAKIVPLKDLALSLNSLMKARYLSSRKYVREMAQSYGGDMGNLWLMFLEYNLSRPEYDDMRKDLSFRDLVRIKETPFRRVMSVSMVGALWYELAQRRLVQGYVDGLSAIDGESLLGYPEGIDTLSAIKTLQVLTTLSELSSNALSPSASIPTMESDLMIVLTR